MHVPMVTQTEFSLSGLRWLKLDPERAVTVAPGNANPPALCWAPTKPGS